MDGWTDRQRQIIRECKRYRDVLLFVCFSVFQDTSVCTLPVMDLTMTSITAILRCHLSTLEPEVVNSLQAVLTLNKVPRKGLATSSVGFFSKSGILNAEKIQTIEMGIQHVMLNN